MVSVENAFEKREMYSLIYIIYNSASLYNCKLILFLQIDTELRGMLLNFRRRPWQCKLSAEFSILFYQRLLIIRLRLLVVCPTDGTAVFQLGILLLCFQTADVEMLMLVDLCPCFHRSSTKLCPDIVSFACWIVTEV